MKEYKFIEGIPVIAGSPAEDEAIRFSKFLRSHNLKGVNYRTGRGSGTWSLDVYIIPSDQVKPRFQKNNTGAHIISVKFGYFVSGIHNAFMKAAGEFMDSYAPEKKSSAMGWMPIDEKSKYRPNSYLQEG